MITGEYGIFPCAAPHTRKVIDNNGRMLKSGIAVKGRIEKPQIFFPDGKPDCLAVRTDGKRRNPADGTIPDGIAG